MRRILRRGICLCGLVAAGHASAQSLSPATWPPPTETAFAASAGPGEIVSALIPGVGRVTATRQVMRGIGRPLAGVGGRSRVLDPCREGASPELLQLGALSIEAVLAGPERKEEHAQVTAPVLLRIVYPDFLGYEVREAILTCTVDRQGRLLAARP